MLSGAAMLWKFQKMKATRRCQVMSIGLRLRFPMLNRTNTVGESSTHGDVLLQYLTTRWYRSTNKMVFLQLEMVIQWYKMIQATKQILEPCGFEQQIHAPRDRNPAKLASNEQTCHLNTEHIRNMVINQTGWGYRVRYCQTTPHIRVIIYVDTSYMNN